MKIKNPIKRITKGASVVEYGVLTGLIVALAIGSVAATGTEVSRVFGFGASQIADTGILDGSGATAGGGSTPAPSPPWEIPSEDLGYPPGGLVLTFVGTSVSTYFTDPIGGSTIHWGDGTTTTTSAGKKVYGHTFAVDGEHDVVYEGTLSAFESGAQYNIKYVKSFGDVGLTSLASAFRNQSQLERVAPLPSTVTNLSAAFQNADGNITGLKDWETSNVTDIRSIFYQKDGSIDDISGWEVSQIPSANFASVFYQSTVVNDLSAWCVDHVPTRPSNFGGGSLISAPVWGFCGAPDTSDAVHLTYETTSPNEIVYFYITQPSGGANAAVVHFDGGRVEPFYGTDEQVSHRFADPGTHTIHISNKLQSFRAGGLVRTVESFGNVGLVKLDRTFENSTILTSVAPLPATITELKNTFRNADSDITGLKDWDVSNVTSMQSIFSEMNGTVDDISEWDISNMNASTGLAAAFYNSTLKQDLSKWCVDTASTAPTNFGGNSLISKPVWAFCGAPDPSNGVHMTFQTTTPNEQMYFWVTQPSGGVNAATVHFDDGKVIPVSGTDTQVSHRFADPGIHTIKIGNKVQSFRGGAHILSVESFGNIGLTSLERAFQNSTLISNIAPLPPTVTSLYATFNNAKSDVSGLTAWETSNVTDMRSIFYKMTGTVDDISGWDVSNIPSATQLTYAFRESTLAQDLSDWCVENIPSEPSYFGSSYLTGSPVWGAACS